MPQDELLDRLTPDVRRRMATWPRDVRDVGVFVDWLTDGYEYGGSGYLVQSLKDMLRLYAPDPALMLYLPTEKPEIGRLKSAIPAMPTPWGELALADWLRRNGDADRSDALVRFVKLLAVRLPGEHHLSGEKWFVLKLFDDVPIHRTPRQLMFRPDGDIVVEIMRRGIVASIPPCDLVSRPRFSVSPSTRGAAYKPYSPTAADVVAWCVQQAYTPKNVRQNTSDVID